MRKEIGNTFLCRSSGVYLCSLVVLSEHYQPIVPWDKTSDGVDFHCLFLEDAAVSV